MKSNSVIQGPVRIALSIVLTVCLVMATLSTAIHPVYAATEYTQDTASSMPIILNSQLEAQADAVTLLEEKHKQIQPLVSPGESASPTDGDSFGLMNYHVMLGLINIGLDILFDGILSYNVKTLK